MSAKTVTEVLIGGKVYKLSGYEGADYLQKVAAYLNEKIEEHQALDSFRHQPADMRSTMLQLNITDDYFKARAMVEKLEREIARKDKEIYELKLDLISTRGKLEDATKKLEDREAENMSIQVENARLKSSLEDIRTSNAPVSPANRNRR